MINDLIRDRVLDLGASALSITHDMASAHKIAHRIAMLYEGRIIWQGPVAEIDRSGNPYVDQSSMAAPTGRSTCRCGPCDRMGPMNGLR